MTKEVFTYLRSYSFDPAKINRLVVSAFLHSFKIKSTDNKLLNSLLIKSEDEEYKNLQDFLTIHTFSDLEELIEVFEFVVSPEDKIVTGAVYTPKAIRDYIVEECVSKFADLESIRICDPACGCSGFLYTAAKSIRERTGLSFKDIFAKNIFGLDIQKYSVERSKLLLTLFAIIEGEDDHDFQFNIFHGNALSFEWSDIISKNPGFEIIVGNPPYVCSRNIDEESKKYVANWKVSSSGHPDLYIPFFQIGIENLKPKGVLGYITMNTFFKSVNGRALRQYFEDEALTLRILDFGAHQVFKTKSTYVCICFVNKVYSNRIEYAKGSEGLLKSEIRFDTIYYNSLNHRDGWNLQAADVVNKIEKKGIPFGELYRTRNGIATLKNHIYIFDPVREDEHFYYLQNGELFPIEKQICKEIINPNKLTTINDIDRLRQKAIFPYNYTESDEAVLMDEKLLKEKYPKAYNYLRAKKSILATRDKGKGNYENWYAYGRNQSLEKYPSKLFFPHITPQVPNYVVSDDQELLFYNGIAVVSDSDFELQFLRKLMSSKLFWFYVKHSSKPYGSGYFSLSRNYIKNFGVCEFNDYEKKEIIEGDVDMIDKILEDKYDIRLVDL